ncbi:MAG TPA: heme exporter protein CcmD [Pyrinomonadaceae bacterium]|nr:heme exporter protein CcmD [Pyrinomonadaceae bacterium]
MSWSEFIYMGDYGFYVWGSYLVSFIAIGGEILFLWKRKRRLQEHTKDWSAGVKNETPS